MPEATSAEFVHQICEAFKVEVASMLAIHRSPSLSSLHFTVQFQPAASFTLKLKAMKSAEAPLQSHRENSVTKNFLLWVYCKKGLLTKRIKVRE